MSTSFIPSCCRAWIGTTLVLTTLASPAVGGCAAESEPAPSEPTSSELACTKYCDVNGTTTKSGTCR